MKQEKDYVKKISMGLIKRMIPFLKPFTKYFIFMGIIMLAIGLFDGLFPLFQRHLIDTILIGGDTEGLLPFILIFSSVTLGLVALVYALVFTGGRLEMGIAHHIRSKAFRHLMELSMDFYHTNSSGNIISRFTSDVTRLGEVISWGLVSTFWGLSVSFAMAVSLLILNPFLGSLVLLVVPPLALVSLYFNQKIMRYQRDVRSINGEITAGFTEGIQGAITTKTLAREDSNLKEFSEKLGKMRRKSVRSAYFSSLYLPVVLLLGSIGTAIALSLGGLDYSEGIMSAGTLAAFISYTVQMFDPIRELARVFSEFQKAGASAERVLAFMDTNPSVKDREGTRESHGDPFALVAEKLEPIQGKIVFDKVSFAYKEENWIIKKMDLEIPPGSTTALVGPTGSGKTTLVNLACRFYEPTKGRILIDGIDYRERSQFWLHSRLGYVIQSPRLFPSTLLENLRYGKPELSKEEVEAALELFGAVDIADSLPQGLETPLSQSGSQLSQGQRQIISLIRAYLADPVFFVLDEPTSSVDQMTEKRIQRAMDRVSKGRTTLIIAHRLSTIRHADRILFLKKGIIVESGNHRELLEKGGEYASLYRMQYEEQVGRQGLVS